MLKKEAPQDERLKELKYWCKTFHEKDLAPAYEGGSYGNLSFRVAEHKDKFIITASKNSLENFASDDSFVTVSCVDLKNGIVRAFGNKEPSSEAMLHYAIYKQRPDLNAIFHGHCKQISSNIKRLGITETKKEESYGTLKLVNRVLDVLGEEPFLEMKNHGFISLGKTIQEAGEQTLRIFKECD